MIERIQKSLHQECGIQPADRFILGVSGGVDSRCLLGVCQRLGYRPIVAYFDHGIRGESAAEAEFVRDVAQAARLEYITEKFSVPALAAEERVSLEAAARKARYQFLFRQAHARNASAVMVAHTADDQAETILMHVIRGSGLGGLLGMQPRLIFGMWHPSIPLLRPMLGVLGSETRAYCEAHGLAWIEDPTNTDRRFLRNRVRHELVPLLETFNPAIREALFRLAEAARGDLTLAQMFYAGVREALFRSEGDRGVRVDSTILRQFEPAARLSLMYRILAHLADVDDEIGLATVQRTLDFALNPDQPGRQDLPGGLSQRRSGSDLILERVIAEKELDPDWPQLVSSEPVRLPIPGAISLQNGWRLVCWQEERGGARGPKGGGHRAAYAATADGDRLAGRLNVRPRQVGDRVQPLGMAGHGQKVSDLMINEKIPRSARAAWPIVVSGEEIVWVPGCRLGHNFRITAETSRVVHFVIERGQG